MMKPKARRLFFCLLAFKARSIEKNACPTPASKARVLSPVVRFFPLRRLVTECFSASGWRERRIVEEATASEKEKKGGQRLFFFSTHANFDEGTEGFSPSPPLHSLCCARFFALPTRIEHRSRQFLTIRAWSWLKAAFYRRERRSDADGDESRRGGKRVKNSRRRTEKTEKS